jgi:quinone-modifying oxidoreductase subunit QmoC
MLFAQWGLVDRIVSDPSIWLCHQCNDCTAKCPRDAKPGDVIQVLRARTIEHLAPVRAVGRLVGNIGKSWPLVLGLPLLLIVGLVYAYNGLAVPENFSGFASFVPHWIIYAVFIPALTISVILLGIGASRAWTLWDEGAERKGAFLPALFSTFFEIAIHRKFSTCKTAKPRKLGHFLIMWGYIGAFITTSLVVIWLFILGAELPFPLMHPLKIIGNIAALFILLGGFLIVFFRAQNSEASGTPYAFDNFFLFLVLAVGVTGITTELFRAIIPMPAVACGSYLIHLGFILTLFISLPYCKLAHFVYRTLAIVHENMRTTK